MTTFDRAFIKAFTDTPEQPTGATARPIAAPHTAGDREPQPLKASRMRETQTPPMRPSAGPPRPLSTFASQAKVHDACRALLEVDRLQWPTACLDLTTRVGREWDPFIDQLMTQMGQGQKCLAFAGVERGSGRTTVTLATARQLAERGLRPVVVDADLENPTLVRGCGISVQTGWDDLVASELGLGEALIVSVEEGVTLMPWRGGHQTLSQLAGMVRTATIFGTLREQYDLVLLDAMPLVGKTAISDFAAFGHAVHLDAIYLVHHPGLTSREQLSSACSKLRRAGAPLAALIENFSVPPRPDMPQRTHDSGAPTSGRWLATPG